MSFILMSHWSRSVLRCNVISENQINIERFDDCFCCNGFSINLKLYYKSHFCLLQEVVNVNKHWLLLFGSCSLLIATACAIKLHADARVRTSFYCTIIQFHANLFVLGHFPNVHPAESELCPKFRGRSACRFLETSHWTFTGTQSNL